MACGIAAKILARSCGGSPQRHTRATLDLAKACVAFCHITIPSLPGLHPKLPLMLQAASVALMNGLVSQAESLVKGGLTIVSDFFDERAEAATGGGAREGVKEEEARCVSFLRSAASFCLLLPGHPQKGPLYVVQGLVAAMKKTRHASNLVQLVPLAAAFSQSPYLYSVKGVDSNDVLYGGDATFAKELEDMGAALIVQSLERLAQDLLADNGGGGGGEPANASLAVLDTIITTILPSQPLRSKMKQLLLTMGQQASIRNTEADHALQHYRKVLAHKLK